MNLSQISLQFWYFAPDFRATKSQMNFVSDFPAVLMLCTRFFCYQDSDELCQWLSCCFSPLHQFFLLLRAKWSLSQISLQFWCFAPDFPATKIQTNFVTDYPAFLVLCTKEPNELCHKFSCSFDALHQLFLLLRAKWILSQISLRFWCFAPDFPAD